MLADLQRDFAQAIRGDAAASARLDIHTAGLTPERRLAVYGNHHRISLAGALATNFPTVVKVVGDEAFRALALSFLTADPPRDPCLAAYGAGFADFLDRDPRSRMLIYLGDVARLDWACNLAERADDRAAFAPEHLAGLDESRLETLCLGPHPSLTLLSSTYPLLRIRDLAAGAEEGVSLDDGGVDLMVWRQAGAVTCVALDRPSYAFVTALAAGRTLGTAVQSLTPDRLPEALAQYVLSGAFLAQDR